MFSRWYALVGMYFIPSMVHIIANCLLVNCVPLSNKLTEVRWRSTRESKKMFTTCNDKVFPVGNARVKFEYRSVVKITYCFSIIVRGNDPKMRIATKSNGLFAVSSCAFLSTLEMCHNVRMHCNYRQLYTHHWPYVVSTTTFSRSCTCVVDRCGPPSLVDASGTVENAKVLVELHFG